VLARGVQTFKDKKGKQITNDYVVVWTNSYCGKTQGLRHNSRHTT